MSDVDRTLRARPAQAPAPAAPSTPPPRRQPRATRWLLVAVLVIHTLVAGGQAVLAGSYFDGDVDAISTHGLNGSLLPAISMIQFVVAVLLWRPARGPWWPMLATAGLFLAEGVQIGMGYSRSLAVHVPLGVTIIAGLVAMTVWSLAWRPQAGPR